MSSRWAACYIASTATNRPARSSSRSCNTGPPQKDLGARGRILKSNDGAACRSVGACAYRRGAVRCVRDNRRTMSSFAPSPPGATVLLAYMVTVRIPGKNHYRGSRTRNIPQFLRPSLTPRPRRYMGDHSDHRLRRAVVAPYAPYSTHQFNTATSVSRCISAVPHSSLWGSEMWYQATALRAF